MKPAGKRKSHSRARPAKEPEPFTDHWVAGFLRDPDHEESPGHLLYLVDGNGFHQLVRRVANVRQAARTLVELIASVKDELGGRPPQLIFGDADLFAAAAPVLPKNRVEARLDPGARGFRRWQTRLRLELLGRPPRVDKLPASDDEEGWREAEIAFNHHMKLLFHPEDWSWPEALLSSWFGDPELGHRLLEDADVGATFAENLLVTHPSSIPLEILPHDLLTPPQRALLEARRAGRPSVYRVAGEARDRLDLADIFTGERFSVLDVYPPDRPLGDWCLCLNLVSVGDFLLPVPIGEALRPGEAWFYLTATRIVSSSRRDLALLGRIHNWREHLPHEVDMHLDDVAPFAPEAAAAVTDERLGVSLAKDVDKMEPDVLLDRLAEIFSGMRREQRDYASLFLDSPLPILYGQTPRQVASDEAFAVWLRLLIRLMPRLHTSLVEDFPREEMIAELGLEEGRSSE